MAGIMVHYQECYALAFDNDLNIFQEVLGVAVAQEYEDRSKF